MLIPRSKKRRKKTYLLQCFLKCLFQMMEQLTDHHYETLTVPDDPAANCIYARVGPKSNVLVHRSADEYPNSVQVRHVY